MIDTNAQPNESSPPTQGPGDRLQSARIAKGMSLEDVANKMHLSTGILTSLEDNNFEDITAPIFVKGYLRAYARLVKVNEEDIIKQYVTHYMDGDPPISSISNTAPEINANDARVKWTTYLVIVVLIGLLSTWWWNRYQQSPETLSLETDATPGMIAEPEPRSIPATNLDDMLRKIESSANDKALDTDNDTSVETVPENRPQQQEIAVVLESKKSSIDKPVEKIEKPAATPVVSSQPATLANPAETQMIPEQQLSAEELADAPESSSMDEVPATLSKDNLQISVNADTWASIEDAEGNRLVYDLLRSGQQLSVSGKAPIKAFFGNGYGVELVYLGKPVDLSREIRSNNTARIMLGQ